MIFRKRRGLEATPEELRDDEAPPSRSEQARHPVVSFVSGFLTFILLVAVVALAVVYSGKNAFEAPGPLAADKVVNIARNSGVQDIADQLQREGVIDRPFIFQAGILAYRTRDQLKAGEYLFPARVSMRDAMEILVEGKAIEHTITIPEGLTSEQIVARLKENEVLVGDVRQIPREGSLLPETYRFSRGTTREQFLQRMAAAQKRVVDELWKARAAELPIRTPEEMITLASIVEKETGKAEERPRVASVFMNRLGRRMRLQSDPTIIYGLVGGKGSLGRSLTRADVESRTPFNTYVIDGLPPGPIANPGKASLEAVVKPLKTKDIYFVADGTGGHAFAETLEEHNRNVARWREIARQAAAEPTGADIVQPAAAPPAPNAGTGTPAARPARPAPRAPARPATPN